MLWRPENPNKANTIVLATTIPRKFTRNSVKELANRSFEKREAAMPTTESGGKRETVTAMDGSTEYVLSLTTEYAATIPDANATRNVMILRSLANFICSVIAVPVPLKKNAVRNEIRKTVTTDFASVFIARPIAPILDIAIPIPKERIGIRSGATSMPPLITTALLTIKPSVEIKAAIERNR